MKKKSFEEALAKLEQITKELEEGDLSLEEALKLAAQCNSKLNDAQKKIEILLKKNDGLEPAAFEGFDEENE
jgi:exodeoxyribonuclease VII small subunit